MQNSQGATVAKGASLPGAVHGSSSLRYSEAAALFHGRNTQVVFEPGSSQSVISHDEVLQQNNQIEESLEEGFLSQFSSMDKGSRLRVLQNSNVWKKLTVEPVQFHRLTEQLSVVSRPDQAKVKILEMMRAARGPYYEKMNAVVRLKIHTATDCCGHRLSDFIEGKSRPLEQVIASVNDLDGAIRECVNSGGRLPTDKIHECARVATLNMERFQAALQQQSGDASNLAEEPFPEHSLFPDMHHRVTAILETALEAKSEQLSNCVATLGEKAAETQELQGNFHRWQRAVCGFFSVVERYS